MRFFRRILGTKQAEPPLSSLEDPILGRLTWDDDSEGWVSSISLGDAVFRLYIGGGSAQEYPSDALLDLLKEPRQTFQRLSGEASAYLRANVNLDAWKVNPEDLKLEGLETYQHYLSDRTYTVTFTQTLKMSRRRKRVACSPVGKS